MEPIRACFRPTDISKVLNISKKSAYRLCNQPDFPAYRIGKRSIVIDPDGFNDWLKQKGLVSDDREGE